MLEENCLDFSTIQLEVLKLIKSNRKVKEILSERFKYIMIDEYQDTNSIQESILFNLLNSSENICVVGDDDQALYRFRGATVQNILEFPNKFINNKCQQINLENNYRSEPDIINFFNNFMHNDIWTDRNLNYRYQKAIKPVIESKNSQNVFSLLANDNDILHHRVLNYINKLKTELVIKDYNQIAFLFSSVKNENVKSLANFLENNNIPVYSPRSNMFFDREEVKLVIGCFIFMFAKNNITSFITNKRNEVDEKINKNKDSERYLSKVYHYYLECFTLLKNHLNNPYNKSLKEFLAEKLISHHELTKSTDYGFTQLFYQLIQNNYFANLLDTKNINYSERIVRNLAIITQLLVKFEYLHNIKVLTPKHIEKTLELFFDKYFKYVYDSGIDEFEDDSDYAPFGCVSFLTIHQSKGLEFPIVIVGSLSNTPRDQQTDFDQMLSSFTERKATEPSNMIKYFDFYRLYYTAFSRAQNLLILSSIQNSRSPSKYFRDDVNKLPDIEQCDLSRLSLSTIKSTNIKNKYSLTSDINVYEVCPEQYRLYKEMEFEAVRTSPALFGQLIHQTIEDIHKSYLNGAEDLQISNKIEDWYNLNYNLLVKKERSYLSDPILKTGLEQVKKYYEKEKKSFNNLLESEVELSFVRESYILNGCVDLIKGDDNTVEIIDFKAEKKPDLYYEKHKIETSAHSKYLPRHDCGIIIYCYNCILCVF